MQHKLARCACCNWASSSRFALRIASASLRNSESDAKVSKVPASCSAGCSSRPARAEECAAPRPPRELPLDDRPTSKTLRARTPSPPREALARTCSSLARRSSSARRASLSSAACSCSMAARSGAAPAAPADARASSSLASSSLRSISRRKRVCASASRASAAATCDSSFDALASASLAALIAAVRSA
eukprot:3819389-Pleurochrysis_carterae.AAC.1